MWASSLGFAGARGESIEELKRNLGEVIEMLLEDGEPAWKAAETER